MRILYFFLTISIIGFSGCFGSPEPTANKNTANASNESNTGEQINTATPEPSRKINDDIETPAPAATLEVAVTLKPLVDKYCKARRDKDEATLRKLYTAATLKSLIADAGAEGKKSLVEYLDLEPVGDDCKVFNERIVGSTGEATFRTKSYPNGITWKFVKENGEWKFTDQSSDFDKVKQGAN